MQNLKNNIITQHYTHKEPIRPHVLIPPRHVTTLPTSPNSNTFLTARASFTDALWQLAVSNNYVSVCVNIRRRGVGTQQENST